MRPIAPVRRLREMLRFVLTLANGAIALVVTVGTVQTSLAQPQHGIAMHGDPALPKDFSVLRYANPVAPKGGRLVQGVIGTFNSLNPLIVKGLALSQIRGYVIESL